MTSTKTSSETPPLPYQNSYWVLPGRFLAGEYPGFFNEERTVQRIDRLIEAGLNWFIDLTAPNELPPYSPILHERAGYYQREVHWEREPIGDFGLPTPEKMNALLNRIDQALEAGHNIYLHCWGGIGRTGTVVGCYLVRHGMDGEQALQKVNTLCHYANSPETPQQRAFIQNWKSHDRKLA